MVLFSLFFFSENVLELGENCGMFWNVFCIENATTIIYKHTLDWSEHEKHVALFSRDGNGMDSRKTAMEKNEHDSF